MKRFDESEIWDNLWNKIPEIEGFGDLESSNDPWTQIHFKKINALISKMPHSSVFLEAGCGLGQWCFYARKNYGLKAIGVDIAKTTIARLKNFVIENELTNLTFVDDDLNDTKLQEECCDVFVSLGVIEHFKDSKPMMKNLHKILKTGGYGLISVPNLYALHTITRPILKVMGKWIIGYEKSFTPKSLENICRDCGFSVIEIGILPSGYLFGHQLKTLFPILGKISYWIERKQNTLGFVTYAIVTKKG